MRKADPLVIQYANTSRAIPLDDIYYIESSNHKVVLHMKDEKCAYYAKIGTLEEQLQGRFSASTRAIWSISPMWTPTTKPS